MVYIGKRNKSFNGEYEMKNCWCDHCGKNLPSNDDLIDLTIDLDNGVEYEVDLCDDCYRELVEYVERFLHKEQID